ncbi:phosphate/phosphite/phosphonate ABC transporter substrate-binding protein [Candidatus Poribacteria bacterium]|nr:phosphate/phosphite/phosphonate ABC transporter substrate-binding protein [Candidatus Poribacteria bacterium]MBT5711981.1 phosphate/phosphite/phosphonate ABC transporter substrate-binding protein [Candidatus Poribacteria bacterium]MBT7096991.1 phosphate/phosphite/phosphonate ABC transporter substrate-binding protein [Candidatus Poribacteria bacterium]MBT7807356.1 phosphate/phosphite/phosphonate ABC transporter substrate-binding protein [Candidatus Poribacteria bacterium]
MHCQRIASGGITITLMALVCLSSCSDSPTPQRVRLDTPQTVAPGSPSEEPAGESQLPLRVAIAAVVSPRESFRYYDDLLGYLSDGLGRPVERLQRPTYAEINDLIRYGGADVAFVCTLAYVVGNGAFGMELLAAPVVHGRQTYRSLIIVPAASSAKTIEDLRGTDFAFTDPLSNSGRLAPTDLLRGRGETPEAFFQRTIYTYSHDKSIRAVADALVDGAAVDSLVYATLARDHPDVDAGARVIWASPEYGMPPVVVSPHLDADLERDIARLLLDMHVDPDGRAILDVLSIERFAPIADAAYDPVREMLRRVGGYGDFLAASQ